MLAALSGLTSAESRVALAVAGGQATDAIGGEFGVSLHTVRKHLANIYDKTGLRSHVALGAFVNRLTLPLD